MSNNKHLVIGLDGGGTKTAVVCIDAKTREVIGSAKVGSTNWNNVGVESAKKELTEGIKTSVGSRSLSEVAAIVLGMSGVDRPEDKERVTSWIHELFSQDGQKPSIQIGIHNDGVIALSSGTGGILYGAVVISGTGMISLGCDKQGNTVRAGGWGPLLGDRGSGFAIGQDIAYAAVAAHDGRGPHTVLLERMLKFCNCEKADQLIPWAYGTNDQKWQKFADLSPLAFQAAREGDKIAIEIIEHAADALVLTISAVLRNLKLNDEEVPLVLAGGNLTHENSILAEHVTKKINHSFPKVKVTKPTVSAEMAAALLAIHQFHIQ